MKGKLRRNIAIPIFALIILGTLSTIPLPTRGSPGANGDIYVDPPQVIYDTSNGTVCTHFNISIRVRNIVVQTSSFQVKIRFRTCYINVTRWWEPTWDPTYVFRGRMTLAVPAPPDVSYEPGDPPNYNDSATVGVSLFPITPPGFTGNGLLCILQFHICSIPSKGLVFATDLNINNDGTFLMDMSGNKIPDINKFDGYYQMTWKEPPRPYQKIQMVDPGLPGVTVTHGVTETISFSQWYRWPCTDFDVEVKIMNYWAAWGMTNATVWVDYNSTLLDIIGGELNVTINPEWLGPNEIELIPGVPDYVKITVIGFSGPEDLGSPVLVATIRFHIIYQDEVPPRNPGDHDDSVISINCTIWDHAREIPQDPAQPGLVKIYAFMALPLAWYEVVPKDTVLGPEPSIGKEFSVDVVVKNLHPEWKCIAYQFRLTFNQNDNLLEGVTITEGPWLRDARWNTNPPTLFISRFDDWVDTIPPCAVVAGVLWPPWGPVYPQAPGPNVPDLVPPVNPIVATITFRAIKQLTVWPPITLGCNLEFMDFPNAESGYFIDENSKYIPNSEHQNGTYSIISNPAIGKVIDVYGGLECHWYEAPYGGQGQGTPMDIVIPQKEVCLWANVTYNFWPVQDKIVSFEVMGPFPLPAEPFVYKDTAMTNKDGIAHIVFRMPWQGCSDPESYFGKYKVTVTVDLFSECIMDTMWFHYDYLVRIFSVTTEKFYYKHCETVKITVEYGTHALQHIFPALFFVCIKDEVNQPIGYDIYETTVGWGTMAGWCKYKMDKFYAYIHVPKWAVAGYANVHVNCFNKEPRVGGVALCPEYTCPPHCPQWPLPYPTIYILPEDV